MIIGCFGQDGRASTDLNQHRQSTAGGVEALNPRGEAEGTEEAARQGTPEGWLGSRWREEAGTATVPGSTMDSQAKCFWLGNGKPSSRTLGDD